MAIHKIKIFSGRGSEYLAEKIAASFGTTLGQSEVLRFSDGEFQPCYNESIRGCTVFIIQSTFPPSDNLMELLMMIDAARRASAYKVVAVIPYFGWARQDRKDRPRVPIGAKLVANLLMAAGVDRVMTMDLHADQIQGFFDVPVDALYASGIFIPYIKSLKIEDLSIASMAIHKIKIFSGRGSEYLAEKIAASFGTTLGQSEVLRFSDGEFQPCYNESIRGCTVFIIQSTFPPSDNLMELLMMIDAARRASAYKVVAVIPYFGWARQDRKDRPRVPIGAKLVANLLMAAGVDRVMTMDLHADQIQGFFDVPVDALYASGIFIPYIKSLKIEDLSIAAPDMGGAKRANTYAKLLGTPIIISHKERAKANVVGKMTAIGEVEGRNILIVDDMIDTAGTICMAADMLMSRGAKSVRAAITHPVLSGPAYERINDSALEEVIVTDTIPLNPDKDLHKFTVLTIADMFADVIERVHNYKEISSIFFK